VATYRTRTRRWTRAEYDRLIERGIFQAGDPIELIGGELMAAEPQSAEHYTAICKCARVPEPLPSRRRPRRSPSRTSSPDVPTEQRVEIGR